MSTQTSPSRKGSPAKQKMSPQEWAASGNKAEGQEDTGVILPEQSQEQLTLTTESLDKSASLETPELPVTPELVAGKPAPDLVELAQRMVRMEHAFKGLRREVTSSAELLDQSMELKCKDVLDHVSYQGRRIGHIERELNIVPSTTTNANEEGNIMENVIAGQEQVAGTEATAEKQEGLLKRLATSKTTKVIAGVAGVAAVAAGGYYAYTKFSGKKDEQNALENHSTDPMAAPAMSYDVPEATRY